MCQHLYDFKSSIDLRDTILIHTLDTVLTLLFYFRILRTRDLELLKGCDIVVDVGGEYNPASHRYDHHQR